jgi:cytochrome c-type biogenesis protein
MSLPEISNPYLGAFTIGIFYGLVVCTASCLPYVTSYIAGTGAGFRKGVKITFIFNSGRILAYALIGAVIGLFSGLFGLIIPDLTVSPFQVYSSIAFGAVTIGVGASLVWKSRKPSKCTLQNGEATIQPSTGRFRGFDFGAFSLGLTRGLIICPPLIALLLTYAISFSNPIGSVTLSVLFGLGTTLSPILVLGGVTGWLLNKAPLFRQYISLAGAGILIALGLVTIAGALIQL